MKISKLRLKKFMSHRIAVRTKLDDEESTMQLLDEARSDTPIIREILLALALLSQLEEKDPEVRQARQVAQHDLTLFLALREIEMA